MWIEIFDSDNPPKLVELNKKRLSLGSHESNDIVINSSSVSRRHLLISIESGTCFVMDVGSTNGTFINDSRLPHGQKTEMTSFFPLRLGKDILISLHQNKPQEEERDKSEDATRTFDLDFFNDDGLKESDSTDVIDLFEDMEEELKNLATPPPVPQKKAPGSEAPKEESYSGGDSTRIISLKDLAQSKTESLVKKRQEVYVKKKVDTKAPPKRRKLSFADMVSLIAVLLLGYAGYEQFFLRAPEEEAPPEVDELQARIAERRKGGDSVKPKRVPPIPDTELMSKASIADLITQAKCTTPEEKSLCGVMASTFSPTDFGAIQVGTKLVVLLDSYALLKEAKELVRPANSIPNPESIHKAAVALFIQKYLPANFAYDSVKDLTVTFAFFDRVDPDQVVQNPEAQGQEAVHPTDIPPVEALPTTEAPPVPEDGSATTIAEEPVPEVDYSKFPPELTFVMAIKGEKLKELKPLVSDTTLLNFSKVGGAAFSYADDYFVIY